MRRLERRPREDRWCAVLFALGAWAMAIAATGCGDNRYARIVPTTVGPDAGVGVDGAVIPTSEIVISEIMYHPVQEDGPVEDHEFIEIFNRGSTTVDLSGWTVTGDVSFAFPQDATLAAGAYAVIARNRDRLAAIAEYALDRDSLFGNYEGELDNGGGTVTLRAPGRAQPMDKVKYDDAFPWPVGADALGASAAWLGLTDDQLAVHQFRGRSLERVNADLPSDDISNWVPSALDGATPGRANTLSGAPPAIVDAIEITPAGTLAATDPLTIRVHVSGHRPVTNVDLQWFVDSAQQTDEPVSTTAMLLVGTGLDGTSYSATLPPQPEHSVIRYRFTATTDEDGGAVISPRASDPFAWHSAFVGTISKARGAAYELFIDSAAWTRLWDNINFAQSDRRVIPETVDGQTVRCAVRPSWDGTVPATFVSDGQVYDVFVRYQGSRTNRLTGSDINAARTTIAPVPTSPNPLRALAWHINFPRYKRFQGRSTVLMNKLLSSQSCPGLDATLGERIYGAAGLPISHAQYARLYINGGYYNYALDLEQPSDEMMQRFLAPGEAMGDLFKSDGTNRDEGPWGWGDERPLTTTACAWTVQERYDYTYARVTNKWLDSSIIRELIEGLAAVRAREADNDTPSYEDLRRFLTEQFDVPAMLRYIAIRNWAEPWDQAHHNHYLYRRANGKWIMVPWDLDKEFGENFNFSATRSFYVDEEGNADNGANNGNWNRIKDAFIKAFRDELNQTFLDLDAAGQPLNPDFVKAQIDDAAMLFDTTAPGEAPIAVPCNFTSERDKLKTFADARHAFLQKTFGAASQGGR